MSLRIKSFLVILLIGAFISGVYILRPKSNPRTTQIIQVPDTTIRIIEGWDMADIATNLELDEKRTEQSSVVDAKTFLNDARKFNVSNYPLLKNNPKGATLEGFLFPDTYFIPQKVPTSTSISAIIIKKTLDNFSKKFTQEMEVRATEIAMSVYDVITLASIVEKESGRNSDERKIVAGIFYNRLNVGMGLESDATVNYVTKKNSPAPTWEDLKTDSPYNTYKHQGLPPGPIANPSLSAIMAVLYPTKTNYFFFLHKQPSGEAVYSTTFEEHVNNKFKYLK